jgi:septum formation inhibitor MinC
MNSSNAVPTLDAAWGEVPELVCDDGGEPPARGPAAILRGTTRGLELVVDGRASGAAIAAALEARLDEAPSFFRGSDVRICVDDGPLAPGCLMVLDGLAMRFDLRIVEIAPRDAAVHPTVAAGSSPSVAPAGDDAVPTPISDVVAPADEPPIVEPPPPPRAPAAAPEPVLPVANGPRLVVGPVRSGVILEHVGHLVVLGDVNPGAEIRASGNIVVLGRLRGTAHAGIGHDTGFIVSLRLEPQQLRIATIVARAADSDAPASEAEIAYVADGAIVVERYTGKLPRNLAFSI